MDSVLTLFRLPNTHQEIFDIVEGRTIRLTLPPASDEVLPGLHWGPAEVPFTPAFWAAQVWFDRDLDMATDFRWGTTLIEEVAGCLLGGHGITWEMNEAAFHRLSKARVIASKRVSAGKVVQLLSRPFELRGKSVRYRFPNQKGWFVAEAINRIAREEGPVQTPLAFRDWLIGFRGIGPKTASWITRNFLGFSRVAVLDIHLYRACILMGLFARDEDVTRKYYALEERYLALADGLNLDPQRLDAVIWKTMRRIGRGGIEGLPSAA